MKLLVMTFAMAVSVTGCAQPQVPASVAAQGTSVICDFFAPGGPNDATERAAIAATQDEPGEAEATRVAIDGIKQIAARAFNDEKKDLLTLATAMSDAELSGSGYNGWSDAMGAFFDKYSEQCGVNPVAS